MMHRDRPNPERWRLAERLFREAAERAPEERDAFLSAACAGDGQLRALVESLLASEGGTLDPWDDPRRPASGGGGAGAAAPCAGFAPGDGVGRYRIVREISRGGMGTVYEAVQDRPERTVALKVLRRDDIGETALARFEYESRILARLHHPCIAQVYDAGTVEVGGRPVPFIAMEYIPEARSLVAHAAEGGLDVRQRLALFGKVCQAVQHAHAQGVIHRDLKPANILVDQSGEPKVIDFGVARLTDRDVAATRHTSAGQIIGTVAYMSPEQCEADPEALDTRSDVYALGVVLYELLAARLPYPVEGRPLHEALRVIREDPPTPPSAIDRRYRGDLDTIVGKALEKDKARRYQTAHDLAADIARHLNDEPIVARAPSAMYHLRKLARRHTALVVSTGAVAVLLFAAVAVITPLYIASERAREEAEQARDEAGLEVERQEAVIDFLSRMLDAADPMETRGEELTVKEMLDGAAGEVERELASRPQVRAIVEAAIGRSYHALGNIPKAREHVRRALELHRSHLAGQPLRLARVLALNADVERVAGDLDAARGMVDEAVALLDAVDPARADPEDLVRRRSTALYSRGVIRAQSLDLEGAEKDLRESYDLLLPASPETLLALAGSAEALGNIFNLRGEFEESRRWYERAIEHERIHGGEESPGLAYTYGNLASVLQELGELDEAQQLAERSIAMMSRLYGEESYLQAIGLMILGDILADRGDAKGAVEAFERGIALEGAQLGEDHPDHALSLWRYGYAMLRLGLHERAEAPLRRSLEIAVRGRGVSSELARVMIGNVADAASSLDAHDVGTRVLAPLFAEVTPRDAHLGQALIRLHQESGSAEEAERVRAALEAAGG